MIRILVTDGMEQSAVKELQGLGFEVVEQYYDASELGEKLKEFDVLIVRSATKVREPIINEALGGKLKLIIRGGVGVDNIDVAYAESKGIAVRNTPNASSAAVAELALGHMFALARFIHISNVTMREGKWEKKKYEGIELGRKTLGIIGMGRIGRELAIRAKALGMKVLYTRRRGPAEEYNDFEYAAMEELLAGSDFVSVHTPFDKNSGTLIGEKEFAMMKDGAYLINCSRGKVVSEEALLAALNSGKLSGAGIDVYDEEPTKNIKLVSHPKVSATPHIGASSIEAQERIGEEIVTIIKGFFN